MNPAEPGDLPQEPGRSLGLATDLYELTMAQAYLDGGMDAEASFELSIRTLPPDWCFFLVAGIDSLLDALQDFRFTPEALAYLRSLNLFSSPFLDSLAAFRFSGDVRGLRDGQLVFPGEPILEIHAPVVEAQIVETFVINSLSFATLAASKAARCVLAASGRDLFDFSFRRAHGLEAAVTVARSSYLAGFNGTSNVLAGRLLGIPIVGTMAHSFISAAESEEAAFRSYSRSFPDSTVLLVDTYDTIEGVRKAAQIAREMLASGHRLRGIRLDSGDLGNLACVARRILDESGLPEVRIVTSGNLDEHGVAQLLESGAPIDSFGVGTRLGVVQDAPAVDIVYKLVEYGDQPRWKLSPGKVSLPARKQVYRFVDESGTPYRDVMALKGEALPGCGQPLLGNLLSRGKRLLPREPLSALREKARGALDALHPSLRRLQGGGGYEVVLSPGLEALLERLDAAGGTGLRNPRA
jgi:nicotinate phosphoribosyltransferase